MSVTVTLALLFVAAFLEVGGDALVRKGLQVSSTPSRNAFFLVSAVVFFVYGYIVNSQEWDFGRLLGVYVVCFFIASQIIASVVFHNTPSKPVVIGGLFIVLGGAIMSLAPGK